MKQGTAPEGCIKILEKHIAEKETKIAALRREIKEMRKYIHIIKIGYLKGV